MIILFCKVLCFGVVLIGKLLLVIVCVNVVVGSSVIVVVVIVKWDIGFFFKCNNI